MKKNKLPLSALRVQSFITEPGSLDKILGGRTLAEVCDERSLEIRRCLPQDASAKCNTRQETCLTCR